MPYIFIDAVFPNTILTWDDKELINTAQLFKSAYPFFLIQLINFFILGLHFGAFLMEQWLRAGFNFSKIHEVCLSLIFPDVILKRRSLKTKQVMVLVFYTYLGHMCLSFYFFIFMV